MIELSEVNETNKMIQEEKLDVRTITMGISLLDCVGNDVKSTAEKIYAKVTSYAKDLVKVGNDIQSEYGIPIVHKRISVTPISLIAASVCNTKEDFLLLGKALDGAAKTTGVNFIGGFSAIVNKAMTEKEKLMIESIPLVLSNTERVCASVATASTRTGINMDAVRLCGKIIKELSYLTKDENSIGCAKLVVFSNTVDDNPFMAGAFHGISEGDCVLNVGISGPGVVKEALKNVKNADFQTLCEEVKKVAFKITRAGQMVANEASRRLNVPFGIIDLSLAPTPAVGDSIGEILQQMGLEMAGAPGTTCALALLNDNVKKGGIMASSSVGGLSGAFIPVSEDHAMIDAVKSNCLSLEKLEAMTCVCSVGLDMIAIPGNTSEETISGIIADEMALGMVNNKTTAARLIPVYGKDVGEDVEFGGLLGHAPIMRVNPYSCSDFVNRKGRIPAPIHSFKN